MELDNITKEQLSYLADSSRKALGAESIIILAIYHKNDKKVVTGICSVENEKEVTERLFIDTLLSVASVALRSNGIELKFFSSKTKKEVKIGSIRA